MKTLIKITLVLIVIVLASITLQLVKEIAQNHGILLGGMSTALIMLPFLLLLARIVTWKTLIKVEASSSRSASLQKLDEIASDGRLPANTRQEAAQRAAMLRTHLGSEQGRPDDA